MNDNSLAARVAVALGDPFVASAEQVIQRVPDAAGFGAGVLSAAVRRARGMAGDPWMVALLAARVNGDRLPDIHDRALTTLLGPPSRQARGEALRLWQATTRQARTAALLQRAEADVTTDHGFTVTTTTTGQAVRHGFIAPTTAERVPFNAAEPWKDPLIQRIYSRRQT